VLRRRVRIDREMRAADKPFIGPDRSEFVSSRKLKTVAD
jgi:hypothetical protein